MQKHLQNQLEKLKVELLTLSSFVEDSVHKAVRSVSQLDQSLAQQVIANDQRIDVKEVDIEERALQVLALHQPVATDLRFVVAILKINNDLERIGDLSVNIARRANSLAIKTHIDAPFDLEKMAAKTREMLKSSLDALIKMDTDLANSVLLADKEVDNINRQAYDRVLDEIRKSPPHVEELIHYLTISRKLERIADYATNIAEDVIYMVDGVIIRHGANDSLHENY